MDKKKKKLGALFFNLKKKVGKWYIGGGGDGGDGGEGSGGLVRGMHHPLPHCHLLFLLAVV